MPACDTPGIGVNDNVPGAFNHGETARRLRQMDKSRGARMKLAIEPAEIVRIQRGVFVLGTCVSSKQRVDPLGSDLAYGNGQPNTDPAFVERRARFLLGEFPPKAFARVQSSEVPAPSEPAPLTVT
jgi:hypothetical protein